jgi:CRISPR/Cas system-associated endonuclease Cas1
MWGFITSRDSGGRKAFFRAYEMRMDTLVTHPLFEYRVSHRRLLEIQSRLLARVLEGEIGEYPVFTTRVPVGRATLEKSCREV